MHAKTLAASPSRPNQPLWAMALACLISIALHGEIWRAWQGMATEPLPDIKPPQVIEVALTHAAPSPVAPVVMPAAPPPAALPTPAKPLPKPPEKPKPAPKPKPVAKPAEPKKAAPPKPTPVPKETVPEADSLPRFTAPPAFNPAPAPAKASPTPVPSAAPPLVNAAYSAPGLKNPPTRYPKIAQMRQWEGTVTLKVKVLADGTAGEIQIVSGSGHEILDESAVEQVKEWHFIPAHRGDKTVEDWVRVPISFKLKS